MQLARLDLHALAARVLKDAQPEEAVILAWPLVCGAAVAKRAEAVSFERGTLCVRVPDRGWQSQLHAFSPHYLEKLSRLAGIAVTRITYQIGTTGEDHSEGR